MLKLGNALSITCCKACTGKLTNILWLLMSYEMFLEKQPADWFCIGLAFDIPNVTWFHQENNDNTMAGDTLGLYSISGRKSYRQISRSLEAARLYVIMIVSLWNLTGTRQRCRWYPGPLFNKRTVVLPPNLAKSRNRQIIYHNDRIVLKFDRHLGSVAAEVPVKFQSDRKSLNPKLVVSRLHEILR